MAEYGSLGRRSMHNPAGRWPRIVNDCSVEFSSNVGSVNKSSLTRHHSKLDRMLAIIDAIPLIESCRRSAVFINYNNLVNE